MFTILFEELLELAIWDLFQTKIKATKIERKTLRIIYHCREVQELTGALSFCKLTSTAKEKKDFKKSLQVKKTTSHMFIITTLNR